MPAVHATAVTIAGEALLIRGPSRSGKSRLALALIAASTPARPIVLVGDDCILLREAPDGLVVTPHPRTAGFIERRGLGIVAMPWAPNARLAATVSIGAAAREPLLVGLPHLAIDEGGEAGARAVQVLAWWAREDAACATHPPGKARRGVRSRSKD